MPSLNNPTFRGGFTKNRYRGDDCLKRTGGGGAWTVCRFKEGLGKKEGGGGGGGVFEGGLTPQCTL